MPKLFEKPLKNDIDITAVVPDNDRIDCKVIFDNKVFNTCLVDMVSYGVYENGKWVVKRKFTFVEK